MKKIMKQANLLLTDIEIKYKHIPAEADKCYRLRIWGKASCIDKMLIGRMTSFMEVGLSRMEKEDNTLQMAEEVNGFSVKLRLSLTTSAMSLERMQGLGEIVLLMKSSNMGMRVAVIIPVLTFERINRASHLFEIKSERMFAEQDMLSVGIGVLTTKNLSKISRIYDLQNLDSFKYIFPVTASNWYTRFTEIHMSITIWPVVERVKVVACTFEDGGFESMKPSKLRDRMPTVLNLEVGSVTCQGGGLTLPPNSYEQAQRYQRRGQDFLILKPKYILVENKGQDIWVEQAKHMQMSSGVKRDSGIIYPCGREKEISEKEFKHILLVEEMQKNRPMKERNGGMTGSFIYPCGMVKKYKHILTNSRVKRDGEIIHPCNMEKELEHILSVEQMQKSKRMNERDSGMTGFLIYPCGMVKESQHISRIRSKCLIQSKGEHKKNEVEEIS